MGRVPFAIVLIISYVYIGTLLDTSKKQRYDFLVGSIITIIGIVLWLYAFIRTGKTFGALPEELSGYWMWFDI